MESTNRLDQSGPRPAATVVVVRDSAGGMELLLTVRPPHLRFMGGAVVFPGGALAPADLDPRWERASRISSEHAEAALGERAPHALGAFVCALREAFEEVGFVIGKGPVRSLRRADAGDPGRFLERCLELGIVLATDELVPAGRWVTPEGAPLRFDARFFVARAPDGWEPDPDPAEVADARWSTPSEALAELGAGRAIMAPPTVAMLQRLAECATVDDAIHTMSSSENRSDDAILTTPLSPVVQVVLAPNPGIMTGPGTNTYIVGTGPTIVIDPAVSDERYLRAVLESAGRIESILVTHRHPDHIGGVAALAERAGAPVRAFGRSPAGGTAVRPVSDGDVVAVPGAELRALHTPGHAPDHLCFLLEGTAALFTGDNILGEGTALIAPPDGDMKAYLSSLERLRALDVERIYPGHWRPLDHGRKVIEHYIAHRRARADAIIEALGRNPSTVEDIVSHVYQDTPGHLHPVARLQAEAHLGMLADEGRVTRAGRLWRLGKGN